jgi:predicted short-subunit dehydrogenase-like oxidoreductase (DUF2520 family)
MPIGSIGAGKVSTAFGKYLRNSGVAISGYFDRHADKMAHACRTTHSRICKDPGEVAAISDIILITTRDDQIQDACLDLCDREAINDQHLVGHMSGAHASSILAPLEAFGAAVFSLHPLHSFASEEKAVEDLKHTYFSLEGTDARLKALEKILEKTGNRHFRIRPEDKRIYHLAACIFSNYLTTLMHQGITALEHSGIRSQEGFQAMMPLIEGTLANIERLGAAKALTGPIARGDISTVKHHLEALDQLGLTSLKAFYAYMGMKTLDLAVQDVLKDPRKADAVKAVLQTGE